ncbi:MAG: metalloregulator ArsR/SmtB family transcription factor [Candidatus Woesebacteria bacterium]|jgi:ArsR family transcriptional regulator
MYQQIFNLHSKLLKAMSHPKRLEIIHLLRDQRLCVNDMLEMLDLPQANLSQHLMVLRDAEVVKSKKNGKQVYYSLAHKNFIKASDSLREILIQKHKDTGLEDEFLMKMSDLVPLVHDPVCKMRLSPKTAGYAHKYENEKYFFCAQGCLDKFKKDPAKYVPN